LLVGISNKDDAAVYKLTEEIALVQTVDFFPPIVDDPFTFGEIAVANAVSDIYSMGATPLIGVNIVGFPDDLPNTILTEILKGAASKATEANLLVVGGHTIKDKEPKFGMAVTGIIKPGKQITNLGAKAGDKIILTKPIGTGIATTAAQQGKSTEKEFNIAVNHMKTLNDKAAKAMVKIGVNACIDITGFGLIGHLLNLLKTSNVSAQLSSKNIPLLPGVFDMTQKGLVPGGTVNNFKSTNNQVVWTNLISNEIKLLLNDAQTSGGLLMCVDPTKSDILIEELTSKRISTASIIGEILSPPQDDNDIRIHVI